MKLENLARANELAAKIKKIDEHIDRWENATNFTVSDNIEVAITSRDTKYRYAYMTGVDFNMIKAVSLMVYKDRKEEIEKELEALD